jgi:hypothetical protein
MNKGNTDMTINEDKLATLTRLLEVQGGNPHYALGWLKSMIAASDTRLGLTRKQIKAFNAMLDDNIRWASVEAK